MYTVVKENAARRYTERNMKMKNILKTIALFVTVLALVSCTSNPSDSENTVAEENVQLGDILYEELSDGTLSVAEYRGEADSLELDSYADGRRVTAISAFAFENCASLEELIIPEGFVSVGSCAFSGCSSLRSITFPSGLVDITRDAVEGTPYYDLLGEGAVIINGTLIDYRDGGESEHITLPDGIAKIAARAMSGRESLVSVTLPDGVKEIGERAFARCTSLKDVDIPSSVCSVGIGAFEDTGLFSGSGAVVAGDVLVGFVGEKSDCRIPSGVRVIASGAFAGCSPIAINISDGVEIICSHAFYGLTKTVRINIPESVTEIGERAFAFSPTLSTVAVSENNGFFYTREDGALCRADGTVLFERELDETEDTEKTS